MLEVGKLYLCKEYFLMLYPDPDTAAASASASSDAGAGAAARAAYWSNRFGKNVSYAEKNIPLLVLKAEEKFYEVLVGDCKGWIIYEDWLKIKEIDHA